ncbi:MAG: EamA family transporter [Candidatus Peribacteraceae bacterium]|jgi:uncharacterized membrane protein
MWLIFAILAPFLYAIVHILDNYCVKDIFNKPWLGMFTSSISTLVILLLLCPILIPLTDFWYWGSLNIIFIACASGLLAQLGYGLYFTALSKSETGIIAAYSNIIPALVALWGFVFFGQLLKPFHYIGILILIICSASFYRIDSKENAKLQALILIIAASILQSWEYIIDDHIFSVLPFSQGIFFIAIGMVIGGLSPLIFSKTRNIILEELPLLVHRRKTFVGIEIIDIFALLSAEKAIELGNPALVSSLESALPAFVFLISLFLFYIGHTPVKKVIKQNFIIKIMLVVFMVIGVRLISF